ncbi:ABC transporter substrate-binding protein [Oceanobacillus oncorhynchi subsp. incaldanensis]|uniref:Putative thiamine biosynthesis protein n=1 Tax=Oceanobacillus oncorhynchi TaxID=545501 RepID=A0A0A1MQW6_9BACI|nr:ABC transporter substrate-binding protein [Oceanobacillus oncorhynchi]GIO18962.1 ABC transporter substrate-binding protein [Oceanobacillus oncorhynchi subsp. incaldanensis]CEI82114.1 Putative thiamine biosynthesis protein [Oceanobacillus oncorhynchi]
MKKLSIIVGILISFISLSACGNEKEESIAENNKNTKETNTVSIMLDWYPNAVHSYLYVAEEKGYFEEEGINVDIQFPANPTDPLSLAASGNVTMGLYYQPDVIAARANENIPVKSVAAIVREPLNHIVYRSDDPINSPKELEGKQVGYPGIPVNEAIVKTVVEHDGGDYEKVDMMNVEFELGSSLISEQVDAVSGMYVNHEVPVLRSEGYNIDFINPVDYGVPRFYEIVAVTSDETWEEEQENIEAFWRAARKGYDFMIENEEEALQILLDHQDEGNFPLEKEIEAESLSILLPKMESEQGFGSQEKASWEETAKWLKEYGVIKEIPNIDDIFVNIE